MATTLHLSLPSGVKTQHISRKSIQLHGTSTQIRSEVSTTSLKSFRAPKTSTRCAAADATSSTAEISDYWIPVIPVEALPRGERRLVRQNGETILLLWYRNEIYAIESTSPAEGAYSEGFLNAKLTQASTLEFHELKYIPASISVLMSTALLHRTAASFAQSLILLMTLKLVQ